MSSLFNGCESLTNIIGIEKLETDSVTNMSNMFNGCASLEALNLSGWNVSRATSAGGMFTGCSSLREVTLDASFYKNNNMALLPTPPTTDGYTGNWILESYLNYPFTKQKYVFSPQKLKDEMKAELWLTFIW